MENLQRRASGIYVARLTVPAALRALVGRRELLASTRTRELARAKIVAGGILTRWRTYLLGLQRQAPPSSQMNDESILKIADGHPLLAVDAHLPLGEVAAMVGLNERHLLLMASRQRLTMFHRFEGAEGFLVRESQLSVDDAELGTVVVPGPAQMPADAVRHVAFGVMPVHPNSAPAIAGRLLAGREAEVVAFRPAGYAAGTLFIPDDVIVVSATSVELGTLEVERLRADLASKISPEVLEGARDGRRAALAAPPPSLAAPQPVADGGGRHVSDAIPSFLKDRSANRCSPEHLRRVRAACDLFVELMDDPGVVEVTRALMRRYKEHVLPTVPARENQVRARYKTKSVSESIEAARANGWPSLSDEEQTKRLAWFGECVGWMVREGWLSSDPMIGLVAPAARTAARQQDRRSIFGPDELTTIFSAPWFKSGKGQLTREGTYREFMPVYYWLPALGLFTGARINELCQLSLSDIRCSPSGVWFIDINQEGGDKRLKNPNSKRLIPLHAQLIALGLPAWKHRLEQEGFDRLFPELRFDPAKGYSKDAVKWFSRFLAARGLARDGKLVFHSFRHLFATMCLNTLALPESTVAQLTGHARGTSVLSVTYRKDAPPEDVVAAVAKLRFELPEIAAFDLDAGVHAVRDAQRRKNSGRGL